MAKKVIELTKEQAQEMYYNINNFKLFLNGAEQIDKCFFRHIRFWNPILNQHLKRSRESIDFIQREFNRHFKPIDNDLIEFEAPSSLYRVLDFFGRLHPDKINIIMDYLENKKSYICNDSCRGHHS